MAGTLSVGCLSAGNVSIPSQAGSLLAVQSSNFRNRMHAVSIPSQAGSLLAGRCHHRQSWRYLVSIPSQAGSLLAAATLVPAKFNLIRSQYPHRRAASWRYYIAKLLELLGLSQYPHRRAASWRQTLTFSHTLAFTSQYPHRRAASWRSRFASPLSCHSMFQTAPCKALAGRGSPALKPIIAGFGSKIHFPNAQKTWCRYLRLLARVGTKTANQNTFVTLVSTNTAPELVQQLTLPEVAS